MAEVSEFRHAVTGRVIRVADGTRLKELVTEKGSAWKPVEAPKKRRRAGAQAEPEGERE